MHGPVGAKQVGAPRTAHERQWRCRGGSSLAAHLWTLIGFPLLLTRFQVFCEQVDKTRSVAPCSARPTGRRVRCGSVRTGRPLRIRRDVLPAVRTQGRCAAMLPALNRGVSGQAGSGWDPAGPRSTAVVLVDLSRAGSPHKCVEGGEWSWTCSPLLPRRGLAGRRQPKTDRNPVYRFHTRLPA